MRMQNEFIEMFNSIPTWEEKYEYIIDKCVGLSIPEHLKTEENRIKSCASKLYFYVERIPAVKVYAWGNSPVSLGLAGVLAEIFDGRELIPPYQNIKFQYKTGLMCHLTQARAEALDEMIKILAGS